MTFEMHTWLKIYMHIGFSTPDTCFLALIFEALHTVQRNFLKSCFKKLCILCRGWNETAFVILTQPLT